ncbi:MAG TPA: DUF971 domain-containing protein [Candidatus Poseidoniales archaeon]|nr:MAG: hypothetical protein CXX80_11460 [Euryarchaeota archaeon]HIA39529.1 DUF971 domain-containing protein [Candidatus Poseidoniales archaeon]PXY75591.1 MAG: hypothetical protein CXX80_04570 [Euryarchaeota archaeon]HIA89944.1 DUF971 domain-containing protein [Candidatus Poseidoniales archaeon]HIB59618.1 DUF971 domain-containing protein [Candidatus Poseidoniales archaeon]
MGEVPELQRLERGDSAMELTWSDGTENSVDYRTLRYWCPCAKCGPRRGAQDLAELLQGEVAAYPQEMPTVKTVGGYALHFEWSSGCSSGIYRFERLWSIANALDPDDGKPYVHGAW